MEADEFDKENDAGLSREYSASPPQKQQHIKPRLPLSATRLLAVSPPTLLSATSLSIAPLSAAPLSAAPLSITSPSTSELEFGSRTSQLPVWKEAVLKQAHAHFLRFRKPATERIRELVAKIIPHIKDITYSIEGVQLYDTARKAFDNMRNDLMKGTRALATAFDQQVMRYVFFCSQMGCLFQTSTTRVTRVMSMMTILLSDRCIWRPVTSKITAEVARVAWVTRVARVARVVPIRNTKQASYLRISFSNDGETLPSVKDIIKYIKDEHIQCCFKSTMATIDHSFLDTIPQGSGFGSVRSFMVNLIALAVRVHLEVKYEMITKEKAVAYIYKVDSSTDSNAWIPPLNPFVGPAGARGKRKTTITLPKRTFEFVMDDGSVIPLEIGD